MPEVDSGALVLYGGGDDRPIVYPDGDKMIYRASAVGDCLRALVAAGLQYEALPDPAYLTRAAAEGNLHEPDIVDKVLGMGLEDTGAQDELDVQVVRNQVYLRGHMDGNLHGAMVKVVPHLREGSPVPLQSDEHAVLEAKTMSRRIFEEWQRGRFGVKVRYAYQVSTYMYGAGRAVGKDFLPALYAVKRRDDGFMEYTWIPEPPIKWERIRKRVLDAERWRLRGELPPCDIDRQWGCAYWFLHEEDDGEMAPVVSVSDEIKGMLAEILPVYRDAKDREKAAKLEADEMKDRIHQLMDQATKVDVEGYTVSWVTQHREKTDYKRMIADMGITDEQLAKYKEPFVVEYPLVKEKKS